MKLRPLDDFGLDQVRKALALLRDARTRLLIAGCPRALDRVRKALASTDGALRHARRRADHTRRTCKPHLYASLAPR